MAEYTLTKQGVSGYVVLSIDGDGDLLLYGNDVDMMSEITGLLQSRWTDYKGHLLESEQVGEAELHSVVMLNAPGVGFEVEAEDEYQGDYPSPPGDEMF